MTTIFEITETALNTLTGIPNAMGVMLAADGSLPDKYLVYTLIDGLPEQAADNQETERSYTVQVSIYDRTGLVDIPDVDGAMLAAGFEKGPERMLPYNQDSHHHGLAKDYNILLNQN